MLHKEFDLVIVGAGIVGSLAFYEATKLDKRVLLIDKKIPCQGATGYSGGMLRSFHLNRTLNEYCADAHRFYANIAAQANGNLKFNQQQFITFIPQDNVLKAQQEYKACKSRMNINWCDRSQLIDIVGQDIFPSTVAGVIDYSAGYIDPVAYAKYFIAEGQRIGGDFRIGVEYQDLLVDGQHVQGVSTNFGEIKSNQVILCTGVESKDLLSILDPDISQNLYKRLIQVNYIDSVNIDSKFSFEDLASGLYGRAKSNGAYILGAPIINSTQEEIADEVPYKSLFNQFQRDALANIEWFNIEQHMLGAFIKADCYSRNGTPSASVNEIFDGLSLLTGFSGMGIKTAPYLVNQVLRSAFVEVEKTAVLACQN